MAKVILGAALETIRGKIGGSVFRKTRSGQILTPRVHPAQRKTAGEAFIPANLNRITGDWNGLTDLQKAAWNKYASLLEGALTGYNVYVRNNTRLLNAHHLSLTQINMPPSTPSTPDYVQGLAATESAGIYTIVWTAPDSASQWVQVQYSPQVGLSMRGKRRWVLLPATRSDIGQRTQAITLPDAYAMYYRARSIDNKGRASPWTDAKLSGVAPPPPCPPDWMSLREHRDGSTTMAGNAAFTALTGPTSDEFWIEAEEAETYRIAGYAFQCALTAFLDGKKVQIRWRSPDASTYCRLQIRDGVYDRTDGAQLQINGNCEEGDPPDHWSVTGGQTLTTSTERPGGSGTQSARSTRIGSGDNQLRNDKETGDYVDGVTYIIKFWVRTKDGYTLYIRLTGPGGFDEIDTFITTANTWHEVTVSGACGGTERDKVEFRTWGVADGAWIEVDDVIVSAPDFPDEEAIVTKGAGLLHEIEHHGAFAEITEAIECDLSSALEDAVTIFFQLINPADFSRYLAVEFLKILDAEDTVLLTFDLDSVTMERTGTYADYGYTASGP